jgi:hypothetical protein
MNWQLNKTTLLKTFFLSLLCLNPALSLPLVQAQEMNSGRELQAVIPPIGENPGRRESAGVRGACLPPHESLTVLIPENQVTLTTSLYPTFFFYLPATKAQEALFILYDENDREIYRSIFTIKEMSGLLKLTIPDGITSPKLESGKNYYWQFSMLCDPKNASLDPYVDGWVQRVTLTEDISNNLARASDSEKVDIYATAGIWQDALTTLADLRQNNPSDRNLADQWNELLQNIGLEKIAQEPLIHSH